MGPGPAAGFALKSTPKLEEWAALIDGKIHQHGGQIRLSSLGGIRLPAVLRGRVAFAEALEQCGFQRAGGPGPLGMVRARSLAARVDRALPSGASKQRQRRLDPGVPFHQRRAATSRPASAATHTLSSAVNKRARPTTMADRARPPAGHVGKAGSVGTGKAGAERRYDTDGGLYTKAEFVGEYGGAAEWHAAKRQPAEAAAAGGARHLDTREVERRQQRANRFETVSARHPSPNPNHRAPSKWQEQLRKSQPPPLTTLKELEPKTAGHVRYLHTLQDAAVTVVFAIGPAGTGKTSQAVLEGLRLLKAGAVSRLLLTRPDFLIQGRDEGGEAYLRRLNKPALEIIDEITRPGTWLALQREGRLVLERFDHLRGLTIDNAFVLADEVQNASTTQVTTLSTRMGKSGKLVFTADPNQADRKAANWASTGLLGYATRLEPLADKPEAYPFPSTRCVRFGVGDVVRSAAAAESVEILAQMQADEAASCSAPQMRGGGFAAQALRTHHAAGPAAPPTTALPATAPLAPGALPHYSTLASFGR